MWYVVRGIHTAPLLPKAVNNRHPVTACRFVCYVKWSANLLLYAKLSQPLPYITVVFSIALLTLKHATQQQSSAISFVLQGIQGQAGWGVWCSCRVCEEAP